MTLLDVNLTGETRREILSTAFGQNKDNKLMPDYS